MIALKTSIDDTKFKRSLRNLAARIADPGPALEQIGLVLIRSVGQNFKAGGRPVRWEKSQRARRESGQTLIDTARLKNSITKKVTGKTLRVGTNVKYAAIHQLGGRISKNAVVRRHWRILRQAFGRPVAPRRVLVKSHHRQMNIRIPARPFLMIQDGDWRYIKRILSEHALGE